jgi:hypothetical protein
MTSLAPVQISGAQAVLKVEYVWMTDEEFNNLPDFESF